MAASGDVALEKAEWQDILFQAVPDRLALAKLKPKWPCREMVVHVHRNHAFEPLVLAGQAYFRYADLAPRFLYGGYDDSFTFDWAKGHPADLELIWIDARRYAEAGADFSLGEWFRARLVALRAQSAAPILVVAIPPAPAVREPLALAAHGLAGVHVAELGELAQQLGERFNDLRAARYTGTCLGDLALILLAREMACRWIPAVLGPRVKAIAVDLDHTLYDGVLGEERGGVHLTAGHVELHRQLLHCRKNGLLLALVSRNEEIDVRGLFRLRRDFPLRWADFSATAIGWGDKAEGVRAIARDLNIGMDAILFVDDNPGELALVAARVPGVRTLHAKADPRGTLAGLAHAPGVWRWERSETDALRAADLAAERERKRQQLAVADPEAYLRSLHVHLQVDVRPRPHLKRLQELSQKTNQFNLAMRRLTEAELERYFLDPDGRVASIRLSDRLSDSGVVGIVAGRRRGNDLFLEEIAISCRALGRGLEDVMLAAATQALVRGWECSRVMIAHRTGPRNAPARNWLMRLTGEPLEAEGQVDAGSALGRIDMAQYPVRVEICN